MSHSTIAEHALAELKVILHQKNQLKRCLCCQQKKLLHAFPSYSARYVNTKQQYCSDCIKAKKN